MENNVTLSRRAYFSAGRTLSNPNWDEARNREVFGREALPHGHDYVLDVYYSGAVAQDDGMIVNIADIKPIIADVVDRLDGKFLDADLDYFVSRRATAENIVSFIRSQLPAAIGCSRLTKLRLRESNRLTVQIDQDAMLLTRNYEFAAAHRLHTPHLSEDENQARYGKCNNPRGHGHNYGLEVTVAGEPDPETGCIVPLTELDRIVDEEIFARFDHKHLNEDCPEFTDLIPTSENLARVIFQCLKAPLDRHGRRLVKIGLHETQKNYFEVEA